MNGKLQSLTANGVSLTGDKGQQSVKLLVDTGASFSMVRADVASKLGSLAKLPKAISLTIGDGSKISITDAVLLSMEIGAVKVMDYFLVFETLIEEAILGVSTMRRYGLKIDLEHQAIYSQITEENYPMEFIKKVLTMLGIEAGEDMTEEQALELIKAKVEAKKEDASREEAPASAAILKLLDLKTDASEADIKGTILAMKFPGNVVPRKEYDELKSKLAVIEIESAVNGALAEGKLAPHESDGWLTDLKDGTQDIATFNVMISRRGKVGPMTEKLPQKKEDAPVIGDTAGEKLVSMASALAEKDKISLSDAMRRVQAQNGKLAADHLATMQSRI